MPESNNLIFIRSTQKRNIINHYELMNLIKELSQSYPEFKQYIESNIRNYLIKNFPCVTISENNAHFLYLSYFKIPFENIESCKNPEVVLSKKNGNYEFHQIIISRIVLKDIQDLFDYLRINQIDPKPQNNVIHLLSESQTWHKNYQELRNIAEGVIEVVLEHEKFKWVKLVDFQAFKRESILMKNCVKNYYTNHSLNKCIIYSLRDKENKPLVTAEIRNKFLVQIKGASNSSPEQYNEEISFFLKTMNYSKATYCQDSEVPNYYTMGGMVPYNPYQMIEEELGIFERIKKVSSEIIKIFLFIF